MACLIIVSGPPGAGKTTLAREISKRYGLLLLSRDGLKECLFESLGWSDREWSRKLGATSYALMYHVLESALAAGQSVVIESNFSAGHNGTLVRSFTERFETEVVEIVCKCDPDIAFERFKLRAKSGERHPGHVDGIDNFEGFRKKLHAWKQTDLGLGGTVIELDTSDFTAIDTSPIYSALDGKLL